MNSIDDPAGRPYGVKTEAGNVTVENGQVLLDGPGVIATATPPGR
jgi:hypothetical protein